MSRARESGPPSPPKVLGGKLPRIDGSLKVSGRATYTSDVNLAGMLYAVPVRSTIASVRLSPATAEHPEPGSRLLHAIAVLRKYMQRVR